VERRGQNKKDSPLASSSVRGEGTKKLGTRLFELKKRWRGLWSTDKTSACHQGSEAGGRETLPLQRDRALYGDAKRGGGETKEGGAAKKKGIDTQECFLRENS